MLGVESKRVLFDVKLEIPEQFKEITPSEKLRAYITIFNLGELTNVNVTNVYKIMDMKGSIISKTGEDMEIEIQNSVIKEFILPKYIASGTYVLSIETLYKDTVTTSSDIFYVSEIEFPMRRYIPLYIILVILAIAFAIIIYLNYRKLKNIEKKPVKIRIKD